MYEEVVKKLRRCVRSKCRGCEYEDVTSCRARLNEDAARAIEELNRALDWIPVTERLPEKESYCLTLGERGALRVCYFGVSLKHRGRCVFLDQNKKKVNPIMWKEITK